MELRSREQLGTPSPAGPSRGQPQGRGDRHRGDGSRRRPVPQERSRRAPKLPEPPGTPVQPRAPRAPLPVLSMAPPVPPGPGSPCYRLPRAPQHLPGSPRRRHRPPPPARPAPGTAPAYPPAAPSGSEPRPCRCLILLGDSCRRTGGGRREVPAMDPRPLNDSLQEMLCRSGNGTGNGPGTGTGNGTNGSVCDLFRRGLRGPPAPRGESGEGKERDGSGKGPPLRARPCALRHAGTPLVPPCHRGACRPALPFSRSLTGAVPVPRRAPHRAHHPRFPIPGPGARRLRHCPGGSRRCLRGTRRAVPLAAGGRRGLRQGRHGQGPARPAPLPHCRGRDLQLDRPLGCPDCTPSPEPRPQLHPGWGPWSGSSLRSPG